MKPVTFIARSVRFYWRTHLSVVLAAAVTSAVLVGALGLGDCVRHTLGDLAVKRLGRVHHALGGQDRFFGAELAGELSAGGAGTAAAIILPGSAVHSDTSLRANRVQVLGVDMSFWSLGPPGTEAFDLGDEDVVLNEQLARQLGAKIGERIVLRVPRPTALSRDMALSPTGQALQPLGVTVRAIVGDDAFGRFGLQANQVAPLNAFISRRWLARKFGLAPRANLLLAGSAVHGKASRKADPVQVVGADRAFWPLASAKGKEITLGRKQVVLNARLARQLAAAKGSAIVLRVSRGQGPAPLVLSATVRDIVEDGRPGSPGSQTEPFRALVSSTWLAAELGRLGPANLLLVGEGAEASTLQAALRGTMALADADLHLRPRAGGRWTLGHGRWTLAGGQWELVSGRVFLDSATSRAAAKVDPGATGVLTYFVSAIGTGGGTATPYSMVSAVGPINDDGAERNGPWGLADGEIVINTWLARQRALDLGLITDQSPRADVARAVKQAVGAKITLTYYVVGASRELKTATKTFHVRAVEEITGLAADRTLMPNFPGLSDSESCRDWDKSLPIDLDKINDEDEKYWKDHRGTPKAFVNLRIGRTMWGNRFGDLTAVRFSPSRAAGELEAAILGELDPADVGLAFLPVREQALAAGAESLDLGQYFLYLSFFLIVAAVMLTSLLFGFGVEQRSAEVGTLLALGFTPGRVRRILLAEGAILAAVGAVTGVFGGMIYTRAMLHGLATMWPGVSAASAIKYHIAGATPVVGAAGAFVAAIFAMWLALRRQGRSGVRDLLDGTSRLAEMRPQRKGCSMPLLRFVLVALGVVGLGSIVLIHLRAETAAFVLGSITLLLGLWVCLGVLSAAGRRIGRARPTMISLAIRNAGRRRWRSLTVAALLAGGCFLVVSIQAFHLDAPGDVRDRSSGTGGFVLMGRTATGVFNDLNTTKGRKEHALTDEDLAGVSIVPLRANNGDDASCLNLNRAQRVRLLGVKPELLAAPKADKKTDQAPDRFVSASRRSRTATGVWSLLEADAPGGAVPAIGDEATVVYGLGKAVGDTIDYVDDRGRPFKVKIVATIGNSILQGSLVISEEQFVRRFPSAEGHRVFLVDVENPAGQDAVRQKLSEALGEKGIEIVRTADRLADLNTVQNTYLSIFQALGLLGLLLGSVGIGVVVLRGAMERRSEFALLRAVGFSRSRLLWLMFWEHWGLLAMGLAVGTVAAIVAIWPALGQATAAAGTFPAVTLGLIVVAGTLWILGGTMLALRGSLIDALRNE